MEQENKQAGETEQKGNAEGQGVKLVIRMTEEEAKRLEAAIAAGYFKQFGSLKMEWIPPEELADKPEIQCNMLEVSRPGKSKDDTALSPPSS